MATAKFTTEELARVATRLQAGSTDIEGQLAELRGQVDGLVSSGWEGQAAQSFNDLYTQWQTSAAALRESLNGIAGLLADTSNVYEVTETELAARFRQT